MTHLEITRIGVGGLLQRADVMVDGRSVGLLRSGTTLRVEVDPGVHVLQARLRAAMSGEFPVDVRPDDEIVAVVLDIGAELDRWRDKFGVGVSVATFRWETSPRR